jgi:hypothetical protein
MQMSFLNSTFLNVPEKSVWLEQPTNYVSQFAKTISSSIATTMPDKAVSSVAPATSPKRRGRPPSSKNKPKTWNKMDVNKQMFRKY